MFARFRVDMRASLAIASALSVVLIASLLLAGPAAGGRVTLTGRVAIEHSDMAYGDPTGGRTTTAHVLDTGTEQIELSGRDLDRLPPGATVRLRGERSGGKFVLAQDDGIVNVAPSGSSADSTGGSNYWQRRVAVLMANFTNDTRQPWTMSYANSVLTGPASSAAYWQEVSEGRMSLDFDISGYYTLNVANSTCDYRKWMEAAKTLATNAGIVLEEYTNIMLVLPRQSACWWGGMANVGGRNSWINGSFSTYVTSHELGHNFGIHHASSISCTDSAGARVSLSSTCTAKEYGDPFDVMGTGTRHTSNWHRRQLGFLTTSDQQTVTTSGRYQVATVEVAPGTPRILRVARPAGDYLYLEWRQPYGVFDSFASTSPAVTGVTIRIAPDLGLTRSRLIDNTPETTSMYDSPLGVGRTFFDPLADISISTVSYSTKAAVVDVRFGSGALPSPTVSPTPTPTSAPDTTPPGAPGNLSASSSGATSVIIAWSAASDNVAVAGYRVARNGVTVATLGAATRSFADSRLTPGATYHYAIAAFDAAGNEGQPGEVSYTAPAPDTQPPTTPLNLVVRLVKNRASLSWTPSTDKSGIVSYEIFRDGSRVGVSTTPSFTMQLKVGTYLLLVRAVDGAGNVSGSSNEVTLDVLKWSSG